VIWLYLAFVIFLTLLTVIPTTLSIVRLRKKGTSKDVRKMVSNRYLFYFFIYLVTIIGVIID